MSESPVPAADVPKDNLPSASLIKRLMSMLYDFLLLVALLMVIGIIVSSLTTFLLNDGNAITRDHPDYYLNQIIILTTILITSFLFLGWFWVHGGQTLGMKTWRVCLISDNSETISWDQAFIRFMVAIVSWMAMGLGILWAVGDSQNRCWHDIASRTRLVQLRKK